MQDVEPKVHLITRPQINVPGMIAYLNEIEGTEWLARVFENPDRVDADTIVEFMGRLCYKSWKPGLNPNVTKVREDSGAYLRNVLASGHGSVTEHVNFGFVMSNVSRVFTHEDVRHRVGTAFSQESLRFVRLEDIPFWFPEWAKGDEELYSRGKQLIEAMEEFQFWMAQYFELDDPDMDFKDKKEYTSFMRRFAPEGLATQMGMTVNVRTARHIIEMRTSEHAEEEIRLVFGMVADILVEEAPLLFGDYTYNEETGEWTTPYRKV